MSTANPSGLRVQFGGIRPGLPVSWEVWADRVLLARGVAPSYIQAKKDAAWMCEFLEALAEDGGLL